jgi:hypothetical protein
MAFEQRLPALHDKENTVILVMVWAALTDGMDVPR